MHYGNDVPSLGDLAFNAAQDNKAWLRDLEQRVQRLEDLTRQLRD